MTWDTLCETLSYFSYQILIQKESISPSVYVAFNQLSATNLCGALGETYYSTTLAFASNGLFTSIAPVINNNQNPKELKNQVGEYEWTAFNPDDLLYASSCPIHRMNINKY